MIGGDGLFSFNSKLAVLVSEPDVQIKKVRHAHLILVNLPLHISPACQLLCDSNHHRHMPLLCAPLWAPRPATLQTAVVVFLPGLTFMCLWVVFVKSETASSFQKTLNVVAVREWHLICSPTFRRMLNMVADDQLWAGPLSSRGFKANEVCVDIHILRSSSCLDLCETNTRIEKLKFYLSLCVSYSD